MLRPAPTHSHSNPSLSLTPTVTHKHQTKIGLRLCTKLTQEVFDRLGTCPFLRYCDLLCTNCHRITTLNNCQHLLELNIRYTKVTDLEPISTLPKLRFLDAGSTKVRSCACLAKLGGSIKILYLDDTECESIDEVRRLAFRSWNCVLLQQSGHETNT